ncbi:MAG TPA: YfjP family GTPase [Actinomycetota bacterium]|nr:YfjP family GTPase [Actinomycetota bacterium]
MKTGHEPAKLDRKLVALRVAADNAEGRLDDSELNALLALLTRAGERLGLGVDLTVVALAGATGSGKSSLFNGLVGADLAEVGVRRPTTSSARACVWGSADGSPLLDWLQVPHRHHVNDAALDGLVLLDLPDHDSTELEHRVEVDRLIELVDLFVWVVDPQKYADAALHDGYLRPLATHAPVSLMVLNQVDLLSPEERRRCLSDLARLVEADGMKKLPVVATSARTGEGLDELRSAIHDRVEQRRAVTDRLSADAHQMGLRLSRFCGGDPGKGIDRGERRDLTTALADAAGVHVVTEAVAKSHRRDAALATGWPVTRWLRKLRPDPLKRLHLGPQAAGPTSLRAAGAVERAQVESSIRHVTKRETADLPDPWPTAAHDRVARHTGAILGELDAAVSRTEIGGGDRPLWWRVAGAIQLLLIVAAVVGFLWLALLFGLEWLQIPKPPTPDVADRIPVPTLLLVGGLLAGFVLGAVFALFARVGAARRRRRAYKRLFEEVDGVAAERVIRPLEQELQAYRDFCEAVAQAQAQ